MKAVVLAAGLGERLKPLTYTCPKHLMPVLGKPLLYRILSFLDELKLDEIIIVVSYLREKISQFLSRVNLKTEVKLVDQIPKKGTAAALLSAKNLLSEEFLVVYGDVFLSMKDLEAVARQQTSAVGVAKVADPWNYGVVEIKDKYLLDVVEKPPPGKEPSNLVLAGVYKFSRKILEYLEDLSPSPRGEYELTDAIKLMVKDGFKVKCVEVLSWVDVGRPHDLLKANIIALLERLKTCQHNLGKGRVVTQGISLMGSNVKLGNGVEIQAPVYIGDNCVVEEGCRIGPFTCLGDNSYIGANSVVACSVIMENSIVKEGVFIENSIVGEGCTIKNGVKIKGGIPATLLARKFKVNKPATRQISPDMLGAVMGEGVTIESHVEIKARTLIPPFRVINGKGV